MLSNKLQNKKTKKTINIMYDEMLFIDEMFLYLESQNKYSLN